MNHNGHHCASVMRLMTARARLSVAEEVDQPAAYASHGKNMGSELSLPSLSSPHLLVLHLCTRIEEFFVSV